MQHTGDQVSILHPGTNGGEGKERRTSLSTSVHAVITHTPFPWYYGSATSHVSITHITCHITPSCGCFPPCTYSSSLSGTLHRGVSSHPRHCLCVLPRPQLAHAPSVPRSCTLFLPLFSFVSPSARPAPCLTLPSTLAHTDMFPCIHVPGAVQSKLPLPSSCLPTSVSLSSLQEPMCQAGRCFFDSSTLSAKCIQI